MIINNRSERSYKPFKNSQKKVERRSIIANTSKRAKANVVINYSLKQRKKWFKPVLVLNISFSKNFFNLDVADVTTLDQLAWTM
ncbi:hypothetical protein CUU63_00540 [Bacillus halotolerans]|uniref:Uncharacterized protein n=1 Tax=Bacillus halotolerans TaxID=260554 RepID=A0A9Q6ABI4_9BACI|nr:hypothetical protein CUU63_00540 [Bacillus halotolerans]